MSNVLFIFFFFSSRRRHTRCALVTGVQTCALPICAMTKITNRQADKSYEVYLSLYQAVTGTDVAANIYKQFSPDFFDLVIIDECHRGSAAADSTWREILEYFSNATQIGMTADRKSTRLNSSH